MTIDWSYNKKYTDKFRMDKTCGHSFIEVYERYLEGSKNILEVGTQQGGFIKFCKDQLDEVFFVGADMYPYPRVDKNCWVDLECFNELADDFFIGDAFSEKFYEWIDQRGYKNKFDLVIDDGPHTLESQLWMMERVEHLLNENGVFICEDVDNIEFAKQIKDKSPIPDKTYIWDNSEKSGRWDDICVVVDKRSEVCP